MDYLSSYPQKAIASISKTSRKSAIRALLPTRSYGLPVLLLKLDCVVKLSQGDGVVGRHLANTRWQGIQANIGIGSVVDDEKNDK